MALIQVVMGVSGSGKSTVGGKLAAALGVPYVEGDDFHPPENVARMAAGIPLTDADRQGWLEALRDRLKQAVDAGTGLVLGCSALKRSYRDVLRSGAPHLVLVYLHGSRELLAARLAARQHHYMPASLLDSQLAALQEPSADEHALRCDVADDVDTIVAGILAKEQGRHA
jgi:gluconokinase